jgi:hypothetical protein
MIMRLPWLSVLILTLLAGVHGRVLAQAPSDTLASRPTLTPILAALTPGTPLRVSVSGRRTAGRFMSSPPDRLLLASPAIGAASFAAAEIDTVWIRRPSTGRGAGIGALIGGLAFGAWTLGFAEGDCDLTCAAPFAVGVGLVGAGVGALGGAGVGSQLRSWRRLHP